MDQNLTTWAIGFSYKILSRRSLQYLTALEDRSFFQIETYNLKLGIGSQNNQPYKVVLQYDLLDSETEVKRVRCPVCLWNFVSFRCCTTELFPFLDTALLIPEVFNEMQTESWMEAAFLTAT